MTTITKLTEIVNGSLVPSDKKLDGSLVQISTKIDNKLKVASTGLEVDLTDYYTGSQTDSAISAAIAQAQLSGEGSTIDLSGYATKTELASYITLVDAEESFQDLTANIPTIVKPEINAAIADLVDKPTLETYKTEVAAQLSTTSQAILSITPSEVTVDDSTTPKVNSLPLYTLNNNGDYVLCTPDSWLKIGELYIPAYKGVTIGK